MKMGRMAAIYSSSVIPTPNTVNKENYPAYVRPLTERYLQCLLTNTVENRFYSTAKEQLQESDAIHNEMLKVDPSFAAKALVYARQNGYMRLQPIIGLAKLAKVDTELFKLIFPQVVLIPSDLQDFLTAIHGQGRGEGGRAIKKSIEKWLNDKLSPYWVVKYNGQGRGYSLTDIVKTTHPKAKDCFKNDLFRYLVKGYTKEMPIPDQIRWYENLKQATNDEDRINCIKQGRLPHEVVTGVVSNMTPALWEAILVDMPIFALLRNINTLDRAGVLDKNRDMITAKLTNKEAVSKSKILPFQLLKAYDAVKKSWVQDAIRIAVEYSVDNIPDIPGRSAILLDFSGSMNGEELQTGGIFAFSLYKKTKGNAIFWLFDESVEDPKPSMVDSVLTQASRLRARGGTDTGVGVKRLRFLHENVDNIIIITDEQQNTGSSFFKELTNYRKTVNKNVKAFVIDISSYQTGGMVPPGDTLSYYIYGFSDQVLKFVSMAAKGFGDMVEHVKNSSIGDLIKVKENEE